MGFKLKTAGGGASVSDAFSTIAVPNGTNPVASGASTLTLTSSDSSITITGTAGTDTVDFVVVDSAIDHGSLGGLADDDHTQYALLAGRAGGQTLIGGTAASNNLTLQSTSNATRGVILGNDTFSSPGAGASSERYGAAATAAGASSVSIGNAAASASSNTVTIGASASGGGSGNITIGKSCIVNSGSAGTITLAPAVTIPTSCGSSVFIGTSLVISSGSSDVIAIGRGVTTTSSNAVAVGTLSNASFGNLAFGFQCAATGAATGNAALGNSCTAAGSSGPAIALGSGANCSHSYSALFGEGTSDTDNEFLFGFSGSTNIYTFGDFRGLESGNATIYIRSRHGGVEDGTGNDVWYLPGGQNGASSTSGILKLGTYTPGGASTPAVPTSRLEFQNGNAVFNVGQATAYFLKVDAALCLTAYTDVSLTADNQAVTVANRSHIVISSNNATATNRTFTISNGLSDGQILVLEWSGTNAGELAAAATVKLAGAATWTPTQYDLLTLMWSANATAWLEIGRAANA